MIKCLFTFSAILAAIFTILIGVSDQVSGENEVVFDYEHQPMDDWKAAKDSYIRTKQTRAACDYILSPEEMNNLDFNKVVGLYEKALEHLAKAASYATQVNKDVDPQAASSFDLGGSDLVLKISNKRRELLEEKQKFLEKYAIAGCSSIKGAVLSEKTMFEAWIKVNKPAIRSV